MEEKKAPRTRKPKAVKPEPPKYPYHYNQGFMFVKEGNMTNALQAQVDHAQKLKGYNREKRREHKADYIRSQRKSAVQQYRHDQAQAKRDLANHRAHTGTRTQRIKAI